MRKPQWLAEEVARQGTRVLGGTRHADAAAVVAAAIGDHPGYVAALVAADADRELAAWLKDNAAPVRSPQLALFPGVPARMRVAPTRYAEVASMDAAQLDKAKHMLWARTQNAMDGARESAEHERQVFAAFYDKVRPLLTGDMTVSEALERIEVAA